MHLLHSVVIQWQEILASSTLLFKEDPQSLVYDIYKITINQLKLRDGPFYFGRGVGQLPKQFPAQQK